MPIDLNTIKRNEVENLNLMGTPFIQDDIAKLAAALASNTSIKKLDLSFCNLEDSEFELIAKAILKHPKLELLDIGDNQLTNKSIQLLEELAKLTNISEIKARYNQFDVDSDEYHHFVKVLEALKQPEHETSQSLSRITFLNENKSRHSDSSAASNDVSPSAKNGFENK